MIEIVIRWGMYAVSDISEAQVANLIQAGDMPDDEVFRFATKAEADAFMTGVEASNGWTGYRVMEDGRND